ncbi:hypothetical protein V1478_002184 [Vespula squamosa]|uniref:Uncharacterized protein n=1 Tax=Vespula squamosa TaxID=30214 RepID=A0ABD2BWC2_VESSQ
MFMCVYLHMYVYDLFPFTFILLNIRMQMNVFFCKQNENFISSKFLGITLSFEAIPSQHFHSYHY